MDKFDLVCRFEWKVPDHRFAHYLSVSLSGLLNEINISEDVTVRRLEVVILTTFTPDAVRLF